MEILRNNNRNQFQTALETSKILIVDDDDAIRILLRASLTEWGFEVIEASNGEEAWEIMQRPGAPRLLILDWRMPKMDGLTLCELIRKELDFYPYIIFLSQVSGVTNIIRGLDAGADEFLLKPVKIDELRLHVLAGERIIKFIKIVSEQNKQLEVYATYIKTLEALVTLLASKKTE